MQSPNWSTIQWYVATVNPQILNKHRFKYDFIQNQFCFGMWIDHVYASVCIWDWATSASHFSVLTQIIRNGPLGSHEIEKIKQEMVGPFQQVLEWWTFSVGAAAIGRGEAEIPHRMSEWVKGLGGRSGLDRPTTPKHKTGASWTDFHLAHITDLLDSI